MTEEATPDEKKPDVTVIFVNIVKGFVKDHLSKVAWALLTIACTYIGTTWNKANITIQEYKVLPGKVEKILSIHTLDSTMAKSHMRQDSIKDILSAEQFLILQHQLDSTKDVVKNIVALLLEDDQILTNNHLK